MTIFKINQVPASVKKLEKIAKVRKTYDIFSDCLLVGSYGFDRIRIERNKKTEVRIQKLIKTLENNGFTHEYW